jgi:class 3 adenylate cyclase
MNTNEVIRKLTTIMAADVVEYARLMSEDEEGTLKTFRTYRRITDGLIKKHGGRIFNTAGDAVLAEFDSAVECVRCTISIQEEVNTRNAKLPEDRQIKFRIGVNVGDVMIEGDDLFGDGVNVAARLEGLAKPGGVCISSSTFEQVKNKLSVGFEDLGPQEVKNIPHPIGAFQIKSGSVSVSPGSGEIETKSFVGKWKAPLIAAVILLISVGSGFFYWQGFERGSVSLSNLPDNFSTDSMKADAIEKLMTGITIQGISSKTGNPFVIQIIADGIAEFQIERSGNMSGTTRRETGKWWAENYRFCMQFSRFAEGQKRCPRIVREANKLFATRGDGERIGWTLIKQ